MSLVLILSTKGGWKAVLNLKSPSCVEYSTPVSVIMHPWVMFLNVCWFYYSVGVFKNGRVEIIPNDQGNRITPSYVAFTEEGERLIGDAAKNQLTSNPENTVFDAKRLIGREWGDKAVAHDIKFFPFKVIEKGKKPHVQVSVKEGEMKTFAAEEISAMVLVKMKVRTNCITFF